MLLQWEPDNWITLQLSATILPSDVTMWEQFLVHHVVISLWKVSFLIDVDNIPHCQEEWYQVCISILFLTFQLKFVRFKIQKHFQWFCIMQMKTLWFSRVILFPIGYRSGNTPAICLLMDYKLHMKSF